MTSPSARSSRLHYELSKRWYGEPLSPSWTKKSVADVWHLPPQDGRF